MSMLIVTIQVSEAHEPRSLGGIISAGKTWPMFPKRVSNTLCPFFAVSTTVLIVAKVLGAQSDLKPPATLRCTTELRRSRSEPFLSKAHQHAPRTRTASPGADDTVLATSAPLGVPCLWPEAHRTCGRTPLLGLEFIWGEFLPPSGHSLRAT